MKRKEVKKFIEFIEEIIRKYEMEGTARVLRAEIWLAVYRTM